MLTQRRILGVLLLLASAVAEADPPPTAAVRGRILTSEGREAPHVAVLLEPLDQEGAAKPPRGKAAARTARLDEVWISFVPKVQVVPVGTMLLLGNQDDESHTIHAWLGGETLFNLASVPRGREQAVKLTEPGVVTLTCDVHQEMRGLIVVSHVPYWAVSGHDGTFTVSGVSPGRYRVRGVFDRRDERAPVELETGAEVGVELATVELKGAEAPALTLRLPPVAPSALSASRAAWEASREGVQGTPLAVEPPSYRREFWPRGYWVYPAGVLALALGLAAAIASLRLGERRGVSRLGGVLWVSGLAAVGGAMVVVGLHPGIATALGSGALLGVVILAAEDRDARAGRRGS
jgi:plastocyanin